jgi:RNA polymerase sigma-70 factor (ECF subfamily)
VRRPTPTRPAAPPSDDDLAVALIAAQHGDQHGFATLWRALHPAVLRYLRVVIPDQAEDTASETWLHAIRDLDRFDGGLPAFRGWLFRIARNRALDEHRRRRPVTAADADRVAPDTATAYLEEQDTAWALRIIATLPGDQAEAVALRIVAGLDVRTTADILGKRPGAVRIATMRGLRRLAKHPQVNARTARDTAEGV